MNLYEKLKHYGETNACPMHMPGHKRNTAWMQMENPYGMDITEIHDFDDLHEPEGILEEGMKLAASLYGAAESWYLINGSTAGILAGISACTSWGDTVIMARNCHKSVYHSLLLRHLKPRYLHPPVDESTGIAGSITPEQVKSALEEGDASLVILTSPTYEGILSDVSAIAAICHDHGVPLMIDEAHGAHLGFGCGFPHGAVKAGADVVVQSLHKTLPAFTQTGIIHCQGNLVRPAGIKHYLDIYQTSSPSYILMAGIDRCIRSLEPENIGWMKAWQENLEIFYEAVKNLQVLQLIPGKSRQMAPQGCFFDWDPSKLVISVRGSGHNGRELMEILRDEFEIELEMASEDYVIAMTGAGDTRENLCRMAEALLAIDERWQKEEAGEGGSVHVPAWKECQEILHMLPWEAEETEGEWVAMDSRAIGLISLEFVYAYPPGIPLLVPGEEMTQGVLEQIRRYEEAGIPMRGYEDQENHRLRMVRPEKDEK